MMRVPHLAIVVLFSALAVAGYALLSGYVMLSTTDAAMQGDITGTWKSFAVLAFGFWLGSSSGGKAKDVAPPPDKGVLDLTGSELPKIPGDAG